MKEKYTKEEFYNEIKDIHNEFGYINTDVLKNNIRLDYQDKNKFCFHYHYIITIILVLMNHCINLLNYHHLNKLEAVHTVTTSSLLYISFKIRLLKLLASLISNCARCLTS